jgi:uncharacterized membrane protein
MLSRLVPWSARFVVALLLGCGGEDDEEMPEVDCSTGVPGFAEAPFDKCTACHSTTLSGAARNSAPSNINFDNHDSAATSAAQAVDAVQKGAMPPAGSGLNLSDAEKQDLYRWALCGTPQ